MNDVYKLKEVSTGAEKVIKKDLLNGQKSKSIKLNKPYILKLKF